MPTLQLKRFIKLIQSLFLSLFLIGITMFAFVGLASPALAVNCAVTPGMGTYPTILAAINDTNCDPITIPAETYLENLLIDRSLTLQGAGQTSTIINGDGDDRVITIIGPAVIVHLNDLRITGGDATAAPLPNSRTGGGILVTGGATLRGENLQIDNNLASSSTSGFGGGLAVNSGLAYLTDTLIYSNTATQRDSNFTGSGRGGGIYVNFGLLQLADSQVMTNLAAFRAGDGDSASGGGLHINQNALVDLSGNTWQGNVARGPNSDPCSLSTCVSGLDTEGGGAISAAFPNGVAVITITRDTFTGNIANAVIPAASDNSGRGGAISLHTSNTDGVITATLTAVTMTGNIAATESNGVDDEGRGGAIYARHTDLTIQRANIYDNQAAGGGNGSGGGIYTREPLANDALAVVNSVLAGNQAAGGGEGAQLYINHVNSPSNNIVTIVHSTLADDTLNPKEALFYHSTNASDILAITNTIVASHAVGIQNVNATGKATARYMLFFGNTDNHPSPGTVAFPDMTGWVTGDPDPLFVNPAGNDYHLQAESPAKDVGTDAGVTDDIDGDTRPQDNGFDIGADEFTLPDEIEDQFLIYLPIVIKD